MTLAFIGGGGAGGILLLICLLALALSSLAFFAGGVVFTFMKKTKLSVAAILVAAALGYLPFSFYLEFARSAEAQANRKKDFEVVIVTSPSGLASVSVDGTEVHDDRVMFDGAIDFAIDFGDTRSLIGHCTSFVLRRESGQIDSISLNGLTVSDSVRAAFVSSFPEKRPGMKFDGRASGYTVWFTKVSPEYERFESIWR